MGSKRSEERDKAKEIYLQHNGDIRLTEIAKILDVPDGTVRSWKKYDNWAAELQRDPNAEIPKTNTRGSAPCGNTYSQGNKGGKGAPPHNKRAVRTHEYENFYFSDLSDEQKAFISDDSLFSNEYYQTLSLIKRLTLRELAIINDINHYRNLENKLIVDSVRKDKSERQISHTYHNLHNAAGPASTEDIHESSSHVVIDVHNRIIKLEDTLTRIQSQKQKAVESLHKIKAELETNSFAASDPFEGLTEAELRRLAGGDYLDEPI